MKKLLVLLLLVNSGIVSAKNLDGNKVAENFCYAMQAASQCDGLNMRMDTEGKVDALLGAAVRGQDSPYADGCNTGFAKAIDDKKLCATAWKKFGCQGTEMAGLLQENPFNKPNGMKCVFKGK